MPTLDKTYLTVAQAAARKGVSHSRMRKLVADGRIPSTQIGEFRLVRATDVDRFTALPPGRPKIRKKAKESS